MCEGFISNPAISESAARGDEAPDGRTELGLIPVVVRGCNEVFPFTPSPFMLQLQPAHDPLWQSNRSAPSHLTICRGVAVHTTCHSQLHTRNQMEPACPAGGTCLSKGIPRNVSPCLTTSRFLRPLTPVSTEGRTDLYSVGVQSFPPSPTRPTNHFFRLRVPSRPVRELIAVRARSIKHH